MYFDLQVNGYAGVDFNSPDVATEALGVACGRLAADGVKGILATVITAELPAMRRCLRRLCEARSADPVVRAMIVGFHIEGPFINGSPGYVGAHPPSAVRPADIDSMQRLLDSAEGLTRVVTIAPECDPGFEVTRMLVRAGVTVSAGHCDPDEPTLRASIDSGVSMFTHLGNGCPLQLHRHDNIIQRVLALADRLWVGFIADGVHVPFAALGNYLRAVGTDRAFVVSDAIAAAGEGPGRFCLGDQNVVVDENFATWSSDRRHLVGSACTLPTVERRLRQDLSLGDDAVQRLLYTNPRAAIRFP